MERSPAPLGLVVREGVLHERDQRWEDGGTCRDEGPAHGLRELALIAAEVLDKVLRRGRHHGRGGSRIVGMVHHVLLSGMRRAQPGTAVGLDPVPRLDVAELSRNTSLHTPYHTWLLLPRRAWGTCHPRAAGRAQTPGWARLETAPCQRVLPRPQTHCII